MRSLGYLLITIGFLIGSLVAVLEKEAVSWSSFLPAVAGGGIGVVLVRLALRRRARSTGRLNSSLRNIDESLTRIVANVTRLNKENESIDAYALRHRCDELFPEDLGVFVEARESIAHHYGLQAYADVMSHFAAGERYLSRVWSASADGYLDEARSFLDKAQEQFGEALKKLKHFEQ